MTMKWCVYDLDNDHVIGIWNSYEAAESFWADALDTMETNWAVFPADECSFDAVV